MANLGDARGRIIIDASGAERGFASATRAAGGFVKATAAIAGGLGVAAAVRGATQQVLGFETAMKRVSAVSDATPRQLAALSDQAKRLGADARYGAEGAEAIATAQLELAKGGLSVQQILGGGLETTLAMAAAGDMDVADAAMSAANAMKLFGLEGRDVTQVADAMATAANVTTADVSDFSMAMVQGGGAAKIAGLSFNDAMLALTAMADAGVKGSDAGTSMKAALAQLANPTDKQAELTKQLGVSFFDAAGNMKKLPTISRELGQATAKMTAQQRLATLQTLAGTDGYRFLFGLLDAGPGKLREMDAALRKQGTAQEVAAEKNNTAAVAWREFQQTVVNGVITLGTQALPTLTSLAHAATGFVDDIASGQGTAGQVFGSIGDAAAAVIPVLGDLVATGGEVAGMALAVAAPVLSIGAAFASSSTGAVLLKSALIALVTAYVAGKVAALGMAAATRVSNIAQLASGYLAMARNVGVATTAMRTFSLAMASNPVGMIATGIGLAVGAISMLTGSFNSGPSAADRYKEALDRVTSAAQGMQDAIDKARGAVKSITDADLAAAQSALTVRDAQQRYTTAVAQHGKASAEAKAAEANLRAEQQNRRQALVAQTEAGGRSTQTIIEQAKAMQQATVQAKQDVQASRDQIQALTVRNGFAQRAGRLTDEMTQELVKATTQHKVFGAAVRDGNKGLADVQKQAGLAAKALEGETSPAAQKARADLEAIATADPGRLEQVIASVQAGAKEAESAAEKGAGNVRAALQNVDTTVNLSSFTSSISAGVAVAVSIAAAGAARVRGALSTANADVRNSPSANDLLRTSLRNSQGITRDEGARTVAEADKQGTALRLSMARSATGAAGAWRKAWKAGNVRLPAVVNIASALDAQADAAPAKPGKGASKKAVDAWKKEYAEWVRSMRPTLISSIQQGFGDLASAARDAVSMIGQAMDQELDATIRRLDANLSVALAAAQARYDATTAALDSSYESARIGDIDRALSAAQEAARVADEQKRRAEATKGVGDADAQVARMQAVLDRARTGSERQAAQALLDQALSDRATAQAALDTFEAEVAQGALQRERDQLAASLQAKRDAAQQELEAARTAAQNLHDLEVAAAQERTAAQKAALELQTNNLIYQLDNGLISAKAFQKQMNNVLGGDAAKKAMEASGKTLGLAFANGIKDSRAAIEKEVKGIGSLVTRYLKLNSPAETGPLAFDFTKSGRTLATDFAAGMAASRSLVAREAARVAYAANPAAVATTTAAGAGAFNQTNHIRVDGSVDPRQLVEQMGYASRYGTTFPGSD